MLKNTWQIAETKTIKLTIKFSKFVLLSLYTYFYTHFLKIQFLYPQLIWHHSFLVYGQLCSLTYQVQKEGSSLTTANQKNTNVKKKTLQQLKPQRCNSFSLSLPSNKHFLKTFCKRTLHGLRSTRSTVCLTPWWIKHVKISPTSYFVSGVLMYFKLNLKCGWILRYLCQHQHYGCLLFKK